MISIIEKYKQRAKSKRDDKRKEKLKEFKNRELSLKKTTNTMLSKYCPIVKGDCRVDCSFYNSGSVIYDEMFGYITFSPYCTFSK